MQKRFYQKFLHRSFQEEIWNLQCLKCRALCVSRAEKLQGCHLGRNSRAFNTFLTGCVTELLGCHCVQSFKKRLCLSSALGTTSDTCLGAAFGEVWWVWAALELPMLQDSPYFFPAEDQHWWETPLKLCWPIWCRAWFGILVFNWQHRPQRLCSDLDYTVVHKYIPHGFHCRLPENLILLIIRSFCYSLMTVRRNLTFVWI